MTNAAKTAPSNEAFIPIVQQTLAPWDDVKDDLRQVWEGGRVTVGQWCRRFEDAAAERLGVNHAIIVSSCTNGLMMATKALGLTGEVIIPPFTWTATGLALTWNGVTPVMADILPGTYTLDPDAVEAAITPRTTAISPVTVFGMPPNIDELEAVAKRHGLKVLYDSAQGLGATYKGTPLGGFGNVEVFSMSPTKVATAIEGGVLTTNDDALAARLRQMRDYGKSADGSDIEYMGLSARQSELHAVTAWHSLQRLDRYIATRHELVAEYQQRLNGLNGLSMQATPADRTSTWNYFTIFVNNEAALTRNELQQALADRNIQAKRYFYPALHLQTVFSEIRKHHEGLVPVAETASQQGLALPLFSHMTMQQLKRVCDTVCELLA